MLITQQKLSAQGWTQFGIGAGGQERALFQYPNANSKYDIFVGSDVSGVWRANDVDPLNLNDPTEYNWNYISNNELFRFVNKFYNYHSASPNLFVLNRTGIDKIDLTNQTSQTSKLWEPTPGTPKATWVSDMYVKGAPGNSHSFYFVTGTTRVHDEEYNFKDATIKDFYVATLDATETTVSGVVGYNLKGLVLNEPTSEYRNVFCLHVDEDYNGAGDDDILVGTQRELYHFNSTQFSNLPNIDPVVAPNLSSSDHYSVTSILSIDHDNNSQTINQYLITINSDNQSLGGIWLYDKITNSWENYIVSLNGERKNQGNCIQEFRDLSAEQNTRRFTSLKPIINANIITGWLLFNEINTVTYSGNTDPCDNGPYFVGIFACGVNQTTKMPDKNWQALPVWGTTNDWGWNAAKPCSNINGALLTPDNHLIVGKQGNIFITKNPVNPVNYGLTEWQHIYTNVNTTPCDNQYKHRGYVNTAPKSVLPDKNGNLWVAMQDRLIDLSIGTSGYFEDLALSASTTCYNVNMTNAPNNAICATGGTLSDCFYLTENPYQSNQIFACVGEGFSNTTGRGYTLMLDHEANNPFEWVPYGNKSFCGDTKKIRFARDANGQVQQYLLSKDKDLALNTIQRIYWLNTADQTWTDIGILPGIKLGEDFVISPQGDYIFAINAANKQIHCYNGAGLSWTAICTTTFNTADVIPDKLAIVPYI
ncbi:MAG: hypothetical protein IPO27_17565 [Bacteroidetes bacterium]|nr:hypothetical protein [Bacteroidota bacterium]